ncbi:hypothetical protein [Streptomyces sp. NPDC093598]|uniref:hypothetical protein n=1 Tax=Streptomyces sp. NPDC093598 TaxID=3366046 RepID=UPI0037FB33F4
MTDQTAPQPAEWIDGHPQLESIAAAVWERCERHDSGLVIDDPRSIAVAALAAVLPAPTDRAAVLREAADVADGLEAPKVATFLRGMAVQAEPRRMADEAQQDGARP